MDPDAMVHILDGRSCFYYDRRPYTGVVEAAQILRLLPTVKDRDTRLLLLALTEGMQEDALCLLLFDRAKAPAEISRDEFQWLSEALFPGDESVVLEGLDAGWTPSERFLGIVCAYYYHTFKPTPHDSTVERLQAHDSRAVRLVTSEWLRSRSGGSAAREAPRRASPEAAHDHEG